MSTNDYDALPETIAEYDGTVVHEWPNRHVNSILLTTCGRCFPLGRDRCQCHGRIGGDRGSSGD